MKSTTFQPCMIMAHNTLEQLSYAKRPAFNALWESKDVVSIDVKTTEKKLFRNKYLESTIKKRPRYMVPSVSLDDVQDKSKRKLMIDFIYKTTINQAVKEIWGDFKVQHSCFSKIHIEEQEKFVSNQQVISHLPMRFQGAARKWDSMQSRSFLVNNTCYDKKIKRESTIELMHADKEIAEKEHTIRKLINENKLSIIYDKLSSSYTGYRPYITCKVPIEKKEIN